MEPLAVTHTSTPEEPGRYTAGVVLLEEIQYAPSQRGERMRCDRAGA
jgi:hypothetical protein